MRKSDYLDGEVLTAAFRDQTWAERVNSTGYVVGDRVYAATFDGNIYECIVAGTSDSVPPTFNTNLGDTTTDGGVTWLTLKLGMPKRPLYVALFISRPTDAAAGTEVSGGSYARQALDPGDSNWSAPTVDGNVRNLAAVTFPAPTANWGTVGWFGIFDRLTAGNMLWWAELTQSFTVVSGDPALSFAVDALQVLDSRNRNPGLRTTLP